MPGTPPERHGRHDSLLAGLSSRQAEAVLADKRPLCILAAAGAGKTTVLARRIAWRCATGSASPTHVLALTFTRKAAGELRNRVASLGVRERIATSTFHSAAFSCLRIYWDDRSLRRPAILRDPLRLLSSAPKAPSDRGVLQAVAAEISWAKSRLVAPSGYEAAAAEAGRVSPLPAGAIAALYEHYEIQKRRRRVLDVEDLILGAAEAIETDRNFAAAQRWMHRHLFVDEAQDMNPAQWRLLRAWLGDGEDLCLVGDPLQAIYGWNGSDPAALERFAAGLPDGHVIETTDNWRSSPQVLAAATSVAPPGSPTVPLARRSFRGSVCIEEHPSEAHEAAWVASELRRLHAEGQPWREMAVLARTNAQLGIVGRALKSAEVPWRHERARAEIGRAAARALAALVADGDRPDLGWTDDLLDAAAAAGASPRELSNLSALAAEYAQLSPEGGPGGLYSWIGEDSAISGEAVSLLSFHRSKGLEWNCVFLVGLHDAIVPFGGDRAADPEEERRLLYVAMTRAKIHLLCSWASGEGTGGRRRGRRLSRMLDPSIADQEAIPDPPADALAHISRARRLLGLGDREAKEDPPTPSRPLPTQEPIP